MRIRSTIVLAVLLTAAPVSAEPEGFNRANLRFNQWFLSWVMEPVARGYNFVIPKWGQRRVVDFMANLEGPRDVLSSYLQAKGTRGSVHLARFTLNTTVGVAGFFDVAEKWLDLTASPETLSETFGVWRIPTGTYLILPVLGEFCTRGLVGWVGDGFMNPIGYIPGAPPLAPTAGAYVLRNINLLAQGMPSPWAPEGEWDAYRQSPYKLEPYEVGREQYFRDEAERVAE